MKRHNLMTFVGQIITFVVAEFLKFEDNFLQAYIEKT